MNRILNIAIGYILIFGCTMNVCCASEADESLSIYEVINMAIEKSHQHRAARYHVESAHHNKYAAWTKMLPGIYGNYACTKLRRQPYSISSGRKIPVGAKDVYHWDIQMIQTLFAGWELKSRYDISDIEVALKNQEKDQIYLDVSLAAKIAFVAVLLEQKILQVANQTVLGLKSQEADAQKFFKQELIPLNDLLRTQVALANAIQEQAHAKSELRLAETRLNILLEKPSGSPIHIKSIDHLIDMKTDLLTLIQKGLSQRPVLKAARLLIKIKEKEMAIAKSQYYPEANAFLSYEQDGDNFMAGNNDYGNQFNTVAGVEINWHIFSWGQTRSGIAHAKSELKAARENVLQMENHIRFEIEHAYRNLMVAYENTLTAQQVQDQAKENLRITKLQYQQQVATSTDVLNVQTDLAQADTNYYRALYGYFYYMAQLHRATAFDLHYNEDELPECH